MDVLLTTPPLGKCKREYFYPPTGLLSLASYIRLHLSSVKIRLFDGAFIKSWKHFLALAGSPFPGIIGISASTLLAHDLYDFIGKIKSHNPETLIICGGPHASACSEQILTCSKTDICVIGEGEETLLEILKYYTEKNLFLNLNNIKGIAYKNDSHVITTEPRIPVKDIDSLPFPAWDLVDINRYRGYVWAWKKPEAMFLCSRGCPYNCTFCSNPVWNVSNPRFRARSPGNVVEEIAYLKNSLNVRELYDFSDELNSSLPLTLELLKEIRKASFPDLTFKCQLHAANVNDELAARLKQANFWLAHLGIESANIETLKGIRKNITPEDIITACTHLKKYNIKVVGFFMLFNIWEQDGKLNYETPDDCTNTLRFAKSLLKQKLIDYHTWAVTTPTPGSRTHELCIKHGLKLDPDYSSYDTDHITFHVPGISTKKMLRIKLKGELLQAFYSIKNRDINLTQRDRLIKKTANLFRHLFGFK